MLGAMWEQHDFTCFHLEGLTVVLHATGPLNHQVKLGVGALVYRHRPGRAEFVEEIDTAGQTDQAENVTQRIMHGFCFSRDSMRAR
jgi:hypothetical protein